MAKVYKGQSTLRIKKSWTKNEDKYFSQEEYQISIFTTTQILYFTQLSSLGHIFKRNHRSCRITAIKTNYKKNLAIFDKINANFINI